MIGNLVHYNCAGSKAVGVVTDMFRYESHSENRQHRIPDNCLVISIDWVTEDPKVMPQSVSPRMPAGWSNRPGDEELWPRDWYTKKWYNAQWFKVISKI